MSNDRFSCEACGCDVTRQPTTGGWTRWIDTRGSGLCPSWTTAFHVVSPIALRLPSDTQDRSTVYDYVAEDGPEIVLYTQDGEAVRIHIGTVNVEMVARAIRVTLGTWEGWHS